MYKIIFLGAGTWGRAISSIYKNIPNYQCYFFNKSDSLEKWPKNVDSVFVTVSTTGISWACEILEKAYKASMISSETPIIVCTKGIHPQSGLFAVQHVQSRLSDFRVGILSGPTFADQINPFVPSCADFAFNSLQAASTYALELQAPALRLFPNSDVTGVALGGIYKNVLAIFSGVLRGLKLSDNIWAWVMTLGFQEFYTLGLSMNAYAETMIGLSGLGDIFLSIASKNSRNFMFGLDLTTLNETEKKQQTVEGLDNIKRLINMAKFQNISLPLCTVLADFLEKTLQKKGKTVVMQEELVERLKTVL